MRNSLPFLLFAFVFNSSPAQQPRDSLSDNTVLLIRHAEKPSSGGSLNKEGVARAQAYATYFEPFHEGPLRFKVDALYAGADSENSQRPRLTLEPLSEATHLPIHMEVGTKEPAKLVRQLREQAHGEHPLIAWRHGQIPALLTELGADPSVLLPDGMWPDDVFDWVIVLRFDHQGQLASQQRLTETLKLGLPSDF